MEKTIVRPSNRSWCAASLVGLGGLVIAASAALALPTGFTDLRIQSPQVTDGEFFGRSVASLGNRLVVGAPGSAIPSLATLPGRVYVVELDGTADFVIENPTPAAGDEFGASVSVGGGNIAVGAPFDDTVAADAGAAYVFDGATGALLHTLLVPGSGTNYQCGRAVATLGGDVLVMCGGVYRFDGTTGALLQHYTATGCLGGRGLATIAGDVLSAGYDGTICRFDGASGAVVQTYVDPEPGLSGEFGGSIGVDGNAIVVGGQFFSGHRESVYVFDGTTGVLDQTIRGPEYGSPYNAGFGTSVAAVGGVLVGSGWNSARFYDGGPYAFLGEFRPDNLGVDASRATVTAVFGTSFALWTDTIKPNVGRGSVTLLDACGNGLLSPAEQCDDGNTTGGDGCSATCRLEGCPPTLALPLACHSTLGGSSTVSVQKRSLGIWGVNDDRFVWKWKGASALTDFGNPTANTSYQLCFYDDLFGTPDLQFDVAIPAGGVCAGKPCWQAKGTSGFAYADPNLTPSGIEKATIRAKAGGKAQIAVSGRGGRLALPSVAGPNEIFPFNFGWAVVMVDNDSGQCWIAASGASKNSRRRFKGTAGGS
jgi:cysteine-rich repeat protein